MPGDTPKAKCPYCGMDPHAGRHANFAYCEHPCHATPAPTPFDAALAALDVEPTHHTDRMVTTYDILGLDAVRAAHRAEVEKVRERLTLAEHLYKTHGEAALALSARVAKLEAEQSEARNRAARLEAALRFYADASNYGQSHGADCGQVYTGDGNVEEYHGGDCGMPEVMRDDGAKARAALEEPCKGDSPEAAEEDKP